MKVLVTGATGFIGGYVIRELLKRDCTIVATSKRADGVIKQGWFKEVDYVECNLSEGREDYYSMLKKPDRMIHLAWEGLPNYEELFHYERNLIPQYVFIKKMVEGGLENFTVAGTCLEYGLQEGCLSESMKTDPIVPYGIAKDTLRRFIEELGKRHGFIHKWIRLFYVYGKGQNEKSLLPQLEKSLKDGEKVFNMSGGEQLRDYLPVEKAAEYIVSITLQDKVSGIINCCSNTPVSVRRIVEDYLARNRKDIKLNLGYYPYSSYEPMAFWGCNDKLREALK